jgi:hypothetical protein
MPSFNNGAKISQPRLEFNVTRQTPKAETRETQKRKLSENFGQTDETTNQSINQPKTEIIAEKHTAVGDYRSENT